MKLRPLEEAAGDMVLIEYAEASRKLQADREATVARDAEIAMSTIRAAMADPTRNVDATWLFSLCEQVGKAILAVAKPPETTRGRLGRAAREGFGTNEVCPWSELAEGARRTYHKVADAVIAEQRKIEAEDGP